MDALRNTIALQQKATANLEKILSNMASQAASTSEATQAALAAILARLGTDFRKAGAAAWLALKREDVHVPTHRAPKVELSSVSDLFMQAVFPTLSLATSKGNAGCPLVPVRLDATIVKSKAWIPRSEAAEKDKLAAISSFAERRSRPSNAVLTSKQGTSLDCSHLLVARPSRQPLLRRPRFGFNTRF
ncbi:hypothetical protein BASA81_016668 [Batrachochytrium salamandrivorans]|nr:hypothetical protein BASA81_016668 [Batrachochytrium salamandrivorans]